MLNLSKIMGWAKAALPVLYALFCAAVILMVSEGDYEWMVGEREPDGSALARCALPKSSDDTSDMMIPALILIAALFVPGLRRLVKQRRAGLPLILASGLFVLWLYRFFVRPARC